MSYLSAFLFLSGASVSLLVPRPKFIKNLCQLSPNTLWPLTGLSITAGIIFLISWSNAPLLLAFKNSTLSLKEARSLGFEFYPEHAWIYKSFTHYLFPMLSWAFLLEYKDDKKFQFVLGVLMTATGSVFFSLLSLQKAPIAFYAAFTTIVIIRGWAIKIKLPHIATAATLLIIYFFVSNKFISGLDREVDVTIRAAVNRVFFGQNYAAFAYWDTFPAAVEFLNGQGTPNPAGFFRHEAISVPKLVWNKHMGFLSNKGLTGSMPTYFPMQWYANFGVVGFISSSFLVGFAVGWLSRLSESFKSSKIKILLSTLIASALIKVSYTEFTAIAFDFSLVLAVTTFLSSQLIHNKHKPNGEQP